jgi:hypothetical protein
MNYATLAMGKARESRHFVRANPGSRRQIHLPPEVVRFQPAGQSSVFNRFRRKYGNAFVGYGVKLPRDRWEPQWHYLASQ